jgi:hypothetical protein
MICSGGARIDLVLKMNVPRVSIIGDREAGVPVLVRLSTCCVEELSFDLGDEMISVGHTANIWGSLEQGSLRLWVLLLVYSLTIIIIVEGILKHDS